MGASVSVIIPTHRRKIELLRRAVFSVLDQTYKNIEIVIVDDNYGEKLEQFRNATISFVEDALKTNKNIKLVLNKTNLGGALSRNAGVTASSSDYITFLDDDDVFLPKKVEHQLDYMLESGVNVSFTDLSIFNEKDKLIDKRSRQDLKSMDKDYLLKYHIIKNLTGTETFMFKREIFEKVNGFDDVRVGHEFYLIYKLLILPESEFGYCPFDDIKAYRTSEESISNGPEKIKGERITYKFKKQFFNKLSLKERRYLRCRFRAVLSVSYKRRKNYFMSIVYLFLAFMTDPIISIKEALKLKK